VDLGLGDRRVLVTGGTKGIGRAIVEVLAEEGASVAFCARNESDVKAMESRLRADGIVAVGVRADLGVEADVERWIGDASDGLGGIDGYVSNASALLPPDDDSWRRSFEVDLLALVRAAKLATPFLEQSGTGSIVTISSTAAVEAGRTGAASSYGAMKAALLQYTSALSRELGPRGIRCNVISPGPIEFPGGNWEQISKRSPGTYERTRSAVPLGRLGRPREIANVVAFLLGSASSFVSGAHVVIDGGLTRRHQF
jgi:3-oxoacyl-[acyl-carrier protein] reductase